MSTIKYKSNNTWNKLTNIKIQSSDLPSYTGDYTVTPTLEEQILETNNKKMNDNITVNKIPVKEESNLSGGITLIIGGE